MHLFPILATLRRHRTAAALIVLEIAVTCAIVCNAIFLIGERLARIDQPSGLAEGELVYVQLTGTSKRADALAVAAQARGALRATRGVRSVASTNNVPFGRGGGNGPAPAAPDDPDPPVFAA